MLVLFAVGVYLKKRLMWITYNGVSSRSHTHTHTHTCSLMVPRMLFNLCVYLYKHNAKRRDVRARGCRLESDPEYNARHEIRISDKPQQQKHQQNTAKPKHPKGRSKKKTIYPALTYAKQHMCEPQQSGSALTCKHHHHAMPHHSHQCLPSRGRCCMFPVLLWFLGKNHTHTHWYILWTFIDIHLARSNSDRLLMDDASTPRCVCDITYIYMFTYLAKMCAGNTRTERTSFLGRVPYKSILCGAKSSMCEQGRVMSNAHIHSFHPHENINIRLKLHIVSFIFVIIHLQYDLKQPKLTSHFWVLDASAANCGPHHRYRHQQRRQ